MFRLSAEQRSIFADAVQATTQRQDISGPLSAIYESVADAVELHQPVCIASGKCCQFDEFDHSLFVTTIELACFIASLPTDHSTGVEPCPHQLGGRCSVHAIRPMGCRIFYCDPSAQAWQQELYARLHRDLRGLHERLGVPYFYVEWRDALTAVRGSAAVISQTLL